MALEWDPRPEKLGHGALVCLGGKDNGNWVLGKRAQPLDSLLVLGFWLNPELKVGYHNKASEWEWEHGSVCIFIHSFWDICENLNVLNAFLGRHLFVRSEITEAQESSGSSPQSSKYGSTLSLESVSYHSESIRIRSNIDGAGACVC